MLEGEGQESLIKIYQSGTDTPRLPVIVNRLQVNKNSEHEQLLQNYITLIVLS